MESRLLYSRCDFYGEPEISFVIPTFKRSKYLCAAIDSIVNQRAHCNVKFEIVVVNNDPEDNMDVFIEKYKDENISFYSNASNYGQVGNINQGIALSKGKFVAFLHDDDLLLPEYLDTISKYIQQGKYDCIIPSQYLILEQYRKDIKHKMLNLIFCFRYLYRGKFTEIKYKDCINSFRDVYNPPTCGTVFFKKSIEEYGLFRDVNGAAWDFYNFREFNRNYSVILLHSFLGVRRMYTGMSNKTSIIQEFHKDEQELIKENKQFLFVKVFGNAMAYERKGILYLVGRFFAGLYFYLHNLDAMRFIPKKYYMKYKDTFIR